VVVASIAPGGLPERTNGTVSKTVVVARSPWVQIPHPPPQRPGQLGSRSGRSGQLRQASEEAGESRTTPVPQLDRNSGLSRPSADTAAAMTGSPQRVQVFSLGRPRPGVDRPHRRYYVKWRVDGRDRTRSFKRRAEADRFRSGLQLAVTEGQSFDLPSGLPGSWVEQAGPTWWTWSRDWLALKWPQWSGHSRRTGVESLVLLAQLMVRERAPAPPAGCADWLRKVGYQPAAPSAPSPASKWLDRWSIPLADIDPVLLERVLRATSTRADGASTVAAVARRRRHTLGTVLRTAVRRGALATNPIDRVEWRAPTPSLSLDVSTVPSPDDVRAIVDLVVVMPTGASRYAALFAAVGMAGMRPSEAIGLLIPDLDLPSKGWGLATLRGAVTSPGTRYTHDGSVVEKKGLKQRAAGSVRAVPLPPELVHRLRHHLKQFEPVEGRVFSNRPGRPVTTTNYGPIWVRARTQLWPTGHPLASATVYDLRHSAATMMLRARVPPAEVARRLGHSVDVLMRVYAGVFDDERERSNELIDEALRTCPDR